MTVAEEKRLNELEAQQSLLAKQVDALQKQLGGSAPAADAEEVAEDVEEEVVADEAVVAPADEAVAAPAPA